MYGPQFYNRKFVYNAFFVYSPPFYKSQTGMMGRVLGGWTFSPIFTTGSGQPLQIWPGPNWTTQSFGEGDSNDNYLSLESAVPIGPLPAHGHAYYNAPGAGGFPSIFKNGTGAASSYRNPILGLDTRDTSYLTGLPYWNLDFSIRKSVRVAESVSTEFQAVFVNVLNHNQWLDPGQPWGLRFRVVVRHSVGLGAGEPWRQSRHPGCCSRSLLSIRRECALAPLADQGPAVAGTAGPLSSIMNVSGAPPSVLTPLRAQLGLSASF